ncbi:hypothetical protein KAFR_0G01000 [Kazachstania africana CBS 2517]|uniref:Guanine nucleotide-binding protein subunit gamma n=1 Tax=Kazachstania africana (strain ATCC 22294 / BCRC 22015 / CBS 2517 / CECT 1963 / NBRC 1671 / NRRL Y-8276) TaxID=1071382 RepID=H2AXN3_KAZAF|nr:hypothetical protein KAFR_0G01000 [Kazachstania africana CBS 2517]CCF59133.1 hypothetical protein KAFR_0G01000 [Kazachstania africana CBS 2517]
MSESAQQLQQQQQLSLKIKCLKLKRINELNNKLRNELSRERITASNACLTLVDYASTEKDFVLPDIWGYPKPGSNQFRDHLQRTLKNSANNNMGNGNSNGCCIVM